MCLPMRGLSVRLWPRLAGASLCRMGRGVVVKAGLTAKRQWDISVSARRVAWE